MKTHKILVAEDDTALLKSIRIRLAAQGYEVVCASDGYQAVATALEHAPDMLILDINMPAGDGFSVQDRVCKMANLAHIPIIFITGDRSQHLLNIDFNRGSRALLRKPFDTSALLQAVREGFEEPTETYAI